MSAQRPLATTSASQRPLLQAPYYARSVDETGRPQLHEYRSEDFIERFDADLKEHRLSASPQQAWFERNRLDGEEHPTLRQAIHDGYYMVCCELTCDCRSRPATDPQRVLRSWMTVDPVIEAEGETPDSKTPRLERAYRATLSRFRSETGAGSGVRRSLPFPLRPMSVPDSRCRPHTLLAGFLPLTEALEQIRRGNSGELRDADAQDAAAKALSAAFGDEDEPVRGDQLLWSPPVLDPRLAALIQLLDENLAIGVVDKELVYTTGAAPGEVDEARSVALREWQDWLGDAWFYAIPEDDPSSLFHDLQKAYPSEMNRLRSHLRALPEESIPTTVSDAASALENALQTTGIPPRTPHELRFATRYHYSPRRIADVARPWRDYVGGLYRFVDLMLSQIRAASAHAYLFASFLPVLIRFREHLYAIGSAARALEAQFDDPLKYRRQSLLRWLTREREYSEQKPQEQLPDDRKLIVSAGWMDRGPPLIRRRWLMLIDELSRKWQEAGFGGVTDEEQLYRVTVHARVRGERGCEYLVHSEPSLAFRIASFYETRLMPPRPIRMPSMKHLRKAVGGMALFVPEDVADEVSRLGVEDGEIRRSDTGVNGCWMYIFSIPIVSLCAMILLMLIMTLLNFIFRWLPFAILRLRIPGCKSE